MEILKDMQGRKWRVWTDENGNRHCALAVQSDGSGEAQDLATALRAALDRAIDNVNTALDRVRAALESGNVNE